MADLPTNLTPAQYTALTGSAPTPILTQAQLTAQNASRGISQYNPLGTPNVGGPLNSSILGNTGAITIPPAPTGFDVSGALASGNAMITANGVGSSPTGSSTNPQMNSSLEALLAEIKNTPPSASDQYNKDYVASGIDAKQTDFNTKSQAFLDAQGRLRGITSQLAGINAQAEAAKAQAQGTSGFESFQNAQVNQISRSAALQALPLQAQGLMAQAEVEAAQGNATLSEQILKQAQDHLDTLYQIHQADATAQYNYKSQVFKSVYDYATAQEKSQLDAKQHEADHAFTQQQNNLNYAQSLSASAIKNGQASIAGQISALNPSSPTYMQDIAALAAQIVQPNTYDTLSSDGNVFQVQKDANGRVIGNPSLLIAKPPSSGSNGFTPAQTVSYQNQIEDNMRLNPAINNFTALVNFGVPSVISELGQNPSSVTDTILMRTLAKITDPTTGVREGEYATFEDSIGALGRIQTIPSKWVGKGRLTEEGRKQMTSLVEDRFTAAKTEYNNQYSYYQQQASRVPGVSVPPAYSAASADYKAPTAPAATPDQVFDSVVSKPSGGGYLSKLWKALLGN